MCIKIELVKVQGIMGCIFAEGIEIMNENMTEMWCGLCYGFHLESLWEDNLLDLEGLRCRIGHMIQKLTMKDMLCMPTVPDDEKF